MPLRTLLRFRNPDLTSDLNHRLRDLVSKGVFLGGQVLPVAGTLDVSVPTLGAVGSDGMVTVLEGAAETLTCTAGISQWVLLHAYYVANEQPVAELQVLSELAYDALTTEEQARRIRLARVTLGAAVTEVTSEDITLVGTERIDPVQRSPLRGIVPTATALPDYTDPPTGVTTGNEPYDLYFVEDERIFYTWGQAGTPSWQRVISALEEFALDSHKNNEDDGTIAPDFYDAQHVLVKHRQALDAGTASVALHGASGTDFGTSNPFVDSAFPTTVRSRQDFTGLLSATQVQLSGTYYVGTGSIATANPYFYAATHQTASSLLGSDRRPITVDSIRRSDDTAELLPASDADALGFYDDPIVVLDFTATSQANYSGDLSIFCSLKRGVGQELTSDDTIGATGLGFIRPGEDIPINNVSLSIGSPLTVQDAIETLDGSASGADGTLKKIVSLGSLAGGPDPDSLSWYGGTASALGQLGSFGGSARIAALSNDLICKVETGNQFTWYVGTANFLGLDVDGSKARFTSGLDSLVLNVPTGDAIEFAINSVGILQVDLTSGDPRINALTEDLRYNVPTGKSHIWDVNGATEVTLSATQLAVTSSVNVGGTVVGASGDGTFTRGLAVGFDAAPPDADRIAVGDATFYLDWSATATTLRMDTAGGNSGIQYDKSSDLLRFQNLGVDEATLDADGLRVDGGLYVGSTGTAPWDNDIRLAGGINAGGGINPTTGDGIFINGLTAGFDAAPVTDRIQIADAELYIGLNGDFAEIVFDTTANEAAIKYDRSDGNFKFYQGVGGLEWELNGARLDCKGNGIQNVGSLTATNVSATTALESSQWQRDSSDYLVWVDNTSLALTINSVERVRWETATSFFSSAINVGTGTVTGNQGDGIFSGGVVVGVDAAANAGDVRMTGGLAVGGTVNPETGVGIFTSGVRIGTDTNPVAAAVLQADSTTKGFLPPRMTTTERTNISTPPAGLIVYDTTADALYLYDGTTWRSVNVT